MRIYEKPNYIEVTYHADKNYILFDWSDFSVPLSDMKDLHKQALATAQLKRCYYYIAETSKVHTVLRPEVLQWFGETWVPELIAAGLRATITVVPSSGLAKLSTRFWQAEVVGGIVMKNVATLAEAEQVLRELQQG